jgi:teichuronic acid biosynthesis glycosyltransferase TuaH
MNDLRQLIICSLEEWDEVWRRNQFLTDRILRNHAELRILFVEPAADPLHDLRRGERPRVARLRSVDREGRLKTLRPLKPLPRRLGPATDTALCAQVRVAARVLRFDRPILWLNDVTFAPLIGRTGWPTIYDVTDDWLLAPMPEGKRKRLRALDELAVQNAAEVVVCSLNLARSRGAIRPVTLIPNAVDVVHFQRRRRRPVDLPPPPVAVYVGTLQDARLDVGLVTQLARAIETLNVVLIGPDSLSEPSRAQLALPNVRLLGPRPYEDVPAYLQHANVIVVPHVVDDFTDSLDPIKAYECLAVARPVVATPVAGFRELQKRLSVVEREAFVEAVRKALASPTRSANTDEIPSWDERAEELAKVLERMG